MNKETKQRIVKLCKRIGLPELDGSSLTYRNPKPPRIMAEGWWWEDEVIHDALAEAYFKEFLLGLLVKNGCEINRNENGTLITRHCWLKSWFVTNTDHLEALLDAAEAVLK